MAIPKGDIGDLSPYLKDLVESHGALRAVLLSADGLNVASFGADRDMVDTMSAAFSGLQSLVRGCASFADSAEQPMEMNLSQYRGGGFVFVTAAGADTYLAVATKPHDGRVDVEALSYAMEETVGRLGTAMGVGPRTEEGSDS
ncbi:hypothetical protein AN219_38000 [Streptomyces nanshensis]|nr:hypothetical protein AN219_38000 [Streptomyces nanshensis]